ncbi:hypothetical protein [Amorphus coralli]|uniref:hypothetical protein n=1 Tax=Amorphus coralli TaxID=340680 RepID=UPI0003618CF8|nr:hypothetical protein [Amorphus coralli]
MARTMPDDKGADSSGVTPDDAARYIEGLSAELSMMAHRNGFAFLAYLLDVAREEAAARALEADANRARQS